MIRMLHGDKSDPKVPGHLNRPVHAHVSGQEPEPVLSVDLCNHRRDLVRAGMALASKTPCRIRSMYEGIRLMPWESTPRRSARTRQEATIEAFSGETPLPIKMDSTKAWALVEATCCFFISAVCSMVVLYITAVDSGAVTSNEFRAILTAMMLPFKYTLYPYDCLFRRMIQDPKLNKYMLCSGRASDCSEPPHCG